MSRSRSFYQARVALRQSLLIALALGVFASTVGCDKEKSKPAEAQKAAPEPVPSGMVFNDFLPASGEGATGLGVRGGNVDGGLGSVQNAQAQGAQEASGSADADGTTRVKVTDAGKEPRSVRAYAFVANKTEKRVLTLVQTASQSAGGQAGAPQQMAMKVSVDLTPKQVGPKGATIELKITKVELPGAPPQVGQALAQVQGLSGTFEAKSNGELGELTFSSGPQARNQIFDAVFQGVSQAAQLLLTPLPTSPLGVGATWEISGKEGELDAGAKRFTLKELTPDGAVIESELRVNVPRRAAQNPRGGGVMFVQAEGGGKFLQQVRFKGLVTKAQGEFATKETVEASDPRGGGKQVVTQEQLTKLSVD